MGGHLEVERVALRYQAEARVVHAVEGVSFAVRPGEKFIVLGPSGCGKSTLLQAVAGFLRPSAGQIRLDGRPIERPGPDRVVVFQEFDQLLPWRTVLGNVSYPLRVARKLGRVSAAERARRFVEMVGLAGFADAYPHTLSGGMKQRVAIARALALEPAVLLMDEPFASLDALTRTRMQSELNCIWETTRTTILFVTHSIQEAVLLGSRVMIMTPGPGRAQAVLDNAARGAPIDSPPFLAMQARIGGLLGEQGA
jgi:NitT/TauT family transport system ATP-binding protein